MEVRCQGLNFEKSLTSVDGILDAGHSTPVLKSLMRSRYEEGQNLFVKLLRLLPSNCIRPL